MKTPPFYIGQRVVAIGTAKYKSFQKGDEFIVKEVVKTCCGWAVNVGLAPVIGPLTCHKCGKYLPMLVSNTHWCSSDCFAPISTTFQTISYSKVLETEQELIGVN